MSYICPHCNEYVIIEQVNLLFRHAVLKSTFQQVNPHEKKEVLEQLLLEEKIYGCGKPFQLEGNVLVICDYI